ncbi:hypothetical protein, partial [Agrobacterium larrymoorei]|uniref:hypothetical protein n=1 Tax=Agrobacterium larrymoorei TaxID=160699 RepID=UPI001AED844D
MKEDFGEKIRKLKAEVSTEAVELVINSAFYYMREHADLTPRARRSSPARSAGSSASSRRSTTRAFTRSLS